MSHLAALALAALAPFLGLAAYLAVEIVGREVAATTGRVQGAAQVAAVQVDRFLDHARIHVAYLATRPGVAALDPGRCDPLLQALPRLHAEFANAFTLDAAGRPVCSALPLPPEGLRADPSNYLAQVLERRAFTVGVPMVGALTGKRVVVAAQPLVDARDGRVAGVVAVSMDLVAMAEAIRPRTGPHASVFMVLDGAGRVVTHHPDAAAWIGRDARGTFAYGAAREKALGSVRGADLEEVDRYWGFAPVPDSQWMVLSGIAADLALAPVRRTAALIGVLAVAVALLVAGLCLLEARPIARSVGAIAAAARAMAEGAPLARLEPQGPVEVAALAADLNRMIDHRVAIERDLREREQSLRLVNDHYPGLVAHLDLGLRHRYANIGYRRLLGLAPEGLDGAHVRDVLGEAQFELAKPQFRNALAGERALFEVELTESGRERIDLLLTLVPDTRAGGQVAGLFLFATDVTSWRHAEARLAEGKARLDGLVASAMDAIVTVDDAQRVTLFNPAAERMFDVAAGDILGEHLDQLIPAAVRPGHSRLVEEFARSGVVSRPMGGSSLQGVRANGEAFPVEASISQVEVGGRKWFTAILRDITERRRAEQEVLRLNAELEQRVAERTAELEAANRELQAFDYSISHDLRGPLNRIRGFGDALREEHGEALGPAGRDLLDRLQNAGVAMDQLVGDLLHLSTVTRGELHRADIDVSALAAALLDALQRAHPERTVEWSVQPGMRAHADPGLLRIVLENLLGNAWKFTGRRADARIEVGAATRGGEVEFFVRDNGAGFDPAHADKLFEPFRRLHARAEFEGTGIGLATVQRVLRRHGGACRAESRPGAGATFHFTVSG